MSNNNNSNSSSKSGTNDWRVVQWGGKGKKGGNKRKGSVAAAANPANTQEVIDLVDSESDSGNDDSGSNNGRRVRHNYSNQFLLEFIDMLQVNEMNAHLILDKAWENGIRDGNAVINFALENSQFTDHNNNTRMSYANALRSTPRPKSPTLQANNNGIELVACGENETSADEMYVDGRVPQTQGGGKSKYEWARDSNEEGVWGGNGKSFHGVYYYYYY